MGGSPVGRWWLSEEGSDRDGGVAQGQSGEGSLRKLPRDAGRLGEGGANVKGGSGVPLKASGKVSEGA